MEEDDYDSKFINDVSCISHVEVKEEIIIPESNSDSESTLSDNEKNPCHKLEECSVCCKYSSMFIILKNHECQMLESSRECFFCKEINHWSDCFKVHKESHEVLSDHSTDSTTSDREENDEKCKVCLKYEFMIPLLKSHMCIHNKYDDKKCRDCSEVTHWTLCYKNHIESHEVKFKKPEYHEEVILSDSSASDNETKLTTEQLQKENLNDSTFFKNKEQLTTEQHEEEILSYLSVSDNEVKLKTRQLEKENLSNSIFFDKEVKLKTEQLEDESLNDSSAFVNKMELKTKQLEEENLNDSTFFNNETKPKTEQLEDENLSDSTTSDNEEIQKLLSKTEKKECKQCLICLKYEVMLIILEENHPCEAKNKQEKCENCDEISQWHKCFESHKKTHPNINTNLIDTSKLKTIAVHYGDCGICLKLNSIVTNLVKNHTCAFSKTCPVCQEVSYWLSCLKSHKQTEAKSDLSDNEEKESVDSSWLASDCAVCLKFHSTIIHLNDHICSRQKGKQKCGICLEVSFWSRNYSQHQTHHLSSVLPSKNFLSCSNCGKRFSGEKMLKVHKSYCESSYFTCDRCGKQFVDIFTLKKHKIFLCRNSLNIVQYKCKICKKIFSSSSELKKHEEFHYELGLFKCTQCYSEFKSEFCLRKHKQIHR